jgi:2-keto-4-pentenoate hydratase/2-oxohepta-3-ene-1,7-dioic acid hydratase in catechol pathway
MNSRRNFLVGTGAAVAVAMESAVPIAAAKEPPNSGRYQGPHEMPSQMTLLSMVNDDGTESLGAKTEQGIVDVKGASRRLGLAAPLTLDELLRDGNAAGLKGLISAAIKAGDARSMMRATSDIRYGRLFTNPGKIVCIGLNYRRHALETGMPEPRVPPLFNKFNNSLAAHNCVLPLPPKSVAYKFDYETELLVVMGKTARNVSEADALSYVAGYCVGHDFSARDLQLELPAGQWMIGKTLDSFAPIGPHFVSADLVGDPNNLKIETHVNGELRQDSTTHDFIFNVQQIISYVSRFWSLEPGDIIFTGTPHGVIQGYPKDKRVWLKAGDEIVSSIEKLGDLRFRLSGDA